MAIALVGAVGAVSVGTAGSAVTPAWGTGESRTAGNLLVLQIAVTGSATVATVPSGWASGVTRAGTSCSVAVFYRIATGADAAPTVAAITSGIINAQLSEYSGTDPNTAGVLGSSGVASGTTTPQKATNAAVDSTVGSLMVSAFALLRSSAGTLASDTATYTNGTAISVKNSATSTTSHYNFSYSLTTAKAVADADSQAFTATAVTGVAVALVTFRLPSVLSPTGIASGETFGAATVVGGAPTLLAAYSFDASNGTDVSGNGHTMTDIGGSTTTTFASGAASVLSTAGGYATARFGVANQSVLMGPSFTFMAWAKWHTTDQGDGMLVIGPGAPGTGPENGGYRFYLTNAGQVGTFDERADSISFDVSPTLNVQDTFVHVAFSFDAASGTFTGFVNGASVGSHTGLAGAAAGLWGWGLHGHSSALSDPGVYDDVRLYNQALTAAQITTCMNTPVGTLADPLAPQVLAPTGIASASAFGTATISVAAAPLTLLAAYSFDVSNGADASGNSHTLTDGTGGHASFVTGKDGTGHAVQGDGGGPGAVAFGQSDSTSWLNSSVGDKITIMGWVNLTGTPEAAVIASGNTGGWVNNFALWIIGGDMYALVPDVTTSQATHTTVSTGTWTHFALTYDSAAQSLVLYKNGLAADTTSWNGGTLPFTSAAFSVIGTTDYSDTLLDGSIDDVRVYHGALSAAQVTTCMGVPVGTLADPLAPPSAQTLSPSGIGSGETFGTATVSVAGGGAQTLSPSGIASSETFGTVSLSTGPVSVAPSGIVSGEVFGTATVQPGAVVLSPTAIGSAETFGAVTVQSAVALSPTAISSAEVFGTASISAGAVILSATAIGSAEAFGTAIVQSGVAAVSPTAIASAEAFGIATLVPGVTAVAPSAISSVETFGTATVQSGVTVLNVTAISSAEAFGTAVIQSGIAQLNVNGIASAEAFGALTVQAGPVSVAPASISSAEQLGTVDVQLNAYALRPTGISSAETFGTASITTGAITISVTSISSAESFGVTAIHTGAITLSVQSIDTAEALGIPAIQIDAASVSPLGIDSVEAFGTAFIALATQQTLNISSIDTAEQFGTVSMLGGLFFIEIDSILSEEAFGNSTVVLEPKKPFYFVGPNGEDLISVTPDDLAPLQDELNQFINIGQPDDTVSLTPIDMAPLQVALNQFNPVQAEAGYTVHWLVTPPMVALVGRSAGMVAK